MPHDLTCQQIMVSGSNTSNRKHDTQHVAWRLRHTVLHSLSYIKIKLHKKRFNVHGVIHNSIILSRNWQHAILMALLQNTAIVSSSYNIYFLWVVFKLKLICNALSSNLHLWIHYRGSQLPNNTSEIDNPPTTHTITLQFFYHTLSYFLSHLFSYHLFLAERHPF